MSLVAGAWRYLSLVLALPVLCAIKIYQLVISPLLPSQCRYYPSCSNYAIGCVQNLGILRGPLWAARRLLRCTPFHAGGVDHVPARWDQRHDPSLMEVRLAS